MGRTRKSSKALLHDKRAKVPEASEQAEVAEPAEPRPLVRRRPNPSLPSAVKAVPAPRAPADDAPRGPAGPAGLPLATDPARAESRPVAPPTPPVPVPAPVGPREAAALAVRRQEIARARFLALGLAWLTVLTCSLLGALRLPTAWVLLGAACGLGLALALWRWSRRRRCAPPPPMRKALPFDLDDVAYDTLLELRPLPARVLAEVLFVAAVPVQSAAEIERLLTLLCGEDTVTRFEGAHRLWVESPRLVAGEGERPAAAIETWVRLVLCEGLATVHEHRRVALVRIAAQAPPAAASVPAE